MLQFLYRYTQVLIGLVLFAPLIVGNEFVFPFITPRNYFFRLLVSLMVPAVAVLWVYYKNARPRFHWLHIAVLAVIATKIISSFFGLNLYNSFWSNYERMEGLLAWLYFGLFYFSVVTVFRTKEEWLWLLRVSLIPASIVAGHGLLQAMGVETYLVARQARIESTLGNAAYVGAYALVHMGIATYLMARDRYIWMRVVAGASFILSLIALFLSETRGSAVGLLVGFFVTFLFLSLPTKPKDNSQEKANTKSVLVKIAPILVLLTILSVGAIWVARDSAFVQSVGLFRRMVTISTSDGTASSRLQIWHMAYEGWKERPIFGWGQENFHLIFNKYYTSGVGEEWVDRAHNNLLDQLSMNGLVGLCAYLFMIGLPVYLLIRYRDQDLEGGSILVGLWLGYVVQNQFVFDSINTYIIFFVLLAFIWFCSQESQSNKNDLGGRTQYREVDAPLVFGGTLTVAMVLFAVLHLPGYHANKATIQALVRVDAAPEQSFEYFQKAVEYNSFGNKEIVMQLQLAIGSFLQNQKLSEAFKVKAVEATLVATDDVVAKHPNDARFLAFGSNIHKIARVLDQKHLQIAKEYILRSIEVSPNRADTYIQLAEVYRIEQDTSNALGALDSALALSPYNTKIIKTYITGMLQYDEAEKAVTAVKQAEDSGRVYDVDTQVLFGKSYVATQQWEDAVRVFEQVVTQVPDSVEYWELLATSYEGSGDAEAADAIRERLQSAK